MHTRWMQTAVHVKSQSDACAVLYHGLSATSVDAAPFSSAGTNTQNHILGLLPLRGRLVTYILKLLMQKSDLQFHVRPMQRLHLFSSNLWISGLLSDVAVQKSTYG